MEAKIQRRQALSDARRMLVLDAARAVFLEAGIEGASVREIARRAGYTPGAIYSYFESKEAIYAALLDESIQRLQTAVADAPVSQDGPGQALAARAQAWFDFYAANPRDLDLGFYLVQGMRPRGLTSELDHELNDHLYQALRPCEEALQELGLDADTALRENTALFAHGVGLLLMQHTGAHPHVQAVGRRAVQGLRGPARAARCRRLASAGSFRWYGSARFNRFLRERTFSCCSMPRNPNSSWSTTRSA
ncbi:TetR/AcrR family transcriptional regulator [Variovorax sp. UC74_104]|uniref:TetR/AcrR family transcriptional regulator n=1 Tax=Variovorax sp. UC74_104 TaxID=3374555 RepID=UPI0037580930